MTLRQFFESSSAPEGEVTDRDLTALLATFRGSGGALMEPLTQVASSAPPLGGGSTSGLPLPLDLLPLSPPLPTFQEPAPSPAPTPTPTDGGGFLEDLNSPATLGGILLAMPVFFIALRSWAALKFAGRARSAFGGFIGQSRWRQLLAGLGILTVADFLLSAIGIELNDDQQTSFEGIMDDLDSMVSQGNIMIPPPGRGQDPDTMPNYLTFDLQKGRGWFHHKYINQNVVKAAVANERTKGFRGRGGRRQARTR